MPYPPPVSDDWWAHLFNAARWAQGRRQRTNGRALDGDAPLCALDFAAGALADPSLASALEAEHVDLASLESALLYGPARPLDPEALSRGAGGIAWRRRDAAVSTDHVWTWLLQFQEVADAAWLCGVYPVEDGWRVGGLASMRAGIARALGAAWPFVGRAQREAIVVQDHDMVTRDFVFHLLVDDALLSPVAALRAIRRIERDGEAAVFVGTQAQLDVRWTRVAARLTEASSPLRTRREPMA